MKDEPPLACAAMALLALVALTAVAPTTALSASPSGPTLSELWKREMLGRDDDGEWQ